MVADFVSTKNNLDVTQHGHKLAQGSRSNYFLSKQNQPPSVNSETLKFSPIVAFKSVVFFQRIITLKRLLMFVWFVKHHKLLFPF